MNRRLLLLAVAAGSGIAAPAAAERLVDYTIDETTAASQAAEQGVPLAPLPARSRSHVALEIAPAADHAVTRVGIACSAWKVQNPMSILLKRMFAAWDREGAPLSVPDQRADLTVRVERAATVSRCIATGEMKSSCITRVSIDGSAARLGETAKPFRVEKEEITKGVGVCAGLTRGIGLVSRAAASALLTQLDGAPSAADPTH